MRRKPHEAIFSRAVRSTQQRLGTADHIDHLIQRRHWGNALSAEQIEFVRARDSLYLATASRDGQPYIQHRGGPAGFVNVESPSRLSFLDYAGNRQYITVGNLSENDQGFIFFMDYNVQRRLKLWGRMHIDERIVGAQAELNGYSAEVERRVVFDIEALDENCPRHITPR
jgi:predicted pyridoxine 5'-phosphate oxidase superfamily flavin-nucleotide-binding protein